MITMIAALRASSSEDGEIDQERYYDLKLKITKKLAEIMGFKIYRQDIPSGTYPLFQKYLKVGRWILNRLNKLEEYIQEVTGIDRDTL